MSVEASLADLTRLLISLEQQLHDPAIRRDPAALEALLAEGFREFGSSGRVYDRPAIVEALAAESREPAAPIEAADYTLTPIAPGAALLTYRSSRAGVASLRSSLWVQRPADAEGRWQMLFHQGTPLRDYP